MMNNAIRDVGSMPERKDNLSPEALGIGALPDLDLLSRSGRFGQDPAMLAKDIKDIMAAKREPMAGDVPSMYIKGPEAPLRGRAPGNTTPTLHS